MIMRVPYAIKNDHADCSGFAVIKSNTGELVACHKTRVEAAAHVKALYTNVPDARIKKMSDRVLLLTHDNLHRQTIDDNVVLVHHLIANEIRKRKLQHDDSDSALHGKVVSMSALTMRVDQLNKQLSETEVRTIAEMALRNGTKFVDVHELLTAQGWSLGAMPSMKNMHDESEKLEMESDDYDDESLPFLTSRQNALYSEFCAIVDEMGQFSQDASPDGCGYTMPADNALKSKGLKCGNCVFFEGGGRCHLVQGDIAVDGLCKLWIIEGLKVRKAGDNNDVKKELKTGDFVSWQSSGGTARGRITRIVREGSLAVPETSFKINAEPDDPAVLIRLYRKNPDGEYVAQDQSVGHKMSTLNAITSLEKQAESYVPPEAVQTEGRRALQWISEGHAGDGFTSVGRLRAKQLAEGRALNLRTVTRMKSYLGRHQNDKKAEGFSPGENGYPSPGRVAWAAWGGDAAWTWTQKIMARAENAEKSLIVKSVEEKRFTLGPWYVPNVLDAHNEWTSPDELQNGLWNYVKKNDRTIRLQHQPNTKAGEWVEAMTMPFETVVPVLNASTNTMSKQLFPAGTVFLGVQWEPWAWEMVKKGQIRGYSIGGAAARKKQKLNGIYVDLMQ